MCEGYVTFPGSMSASLLDPLALRCIRSQPIYSKDDKVVGTYDPKAQIHAGALVNLVWLPRATEGCRRDV